MPTSTPTLSSPLLYTQTSIVSHHSHYHQNLVSHHDTHPHTPHTTRSLKSYNSYSHPYKQDSPAPHLVLIPIAHTSPPALCNFHNDWRPPCDNIQWHHDAIDGRFRRPPDVHVRVVRSIGDILLDLWHDRVHPKQKHHWEYSKRRIYYFVSWWCVRVSVRRRWRLRESMGEREEWNSRKKESDTK